MPATPQTPKRSRIAARHATVLGGFLVLAALLWWPLPLHLTTHVPGVPQWAYDEATFVWNIWQFKHAAIDTLSNPLHSDLIYYPLGVDLILYTYNFYHSLVSLPLALAVNLPFASNVSLLVSTALSGYGTWLLVRWLLVREGVNARIAFWAGIVGGAAFAFASNRSVYAALGHYDMVTTQWIPFYALALMRSLDDRLSAQARRWSAALAGVFFAFNGLAEMITALFMAIFTIIVLLAWSTPGAQQAPEMSTEESPGKSTGKSAMRPLILRWKVWTSSLLIIGGVAFVLWGAVLIPILGQFVTADYSLKGWGEAIPLSTDLLGWFTPTVLHPLFGGDLVAELRRVQFRALEGGVRGFRDLNTVFLGWVTLAAALTGAFAWRRRARIWWITTIVFGLFTLGPFLQINGEYQFNLDGVQASVPLPYALLHYLPIIKANRAPNRNSVVLMLALAVLAAYGVAWLLQKIAARRQAGTRALPGWGVAAALVIGGLIVLEHLALPMTLTDLRVPAVYHEIAADPRPVSVLQVPLGWRNSFGVLGPESTLLQYYQTVHGKPMLGGNISRAPDIKMDYFARIPWFHALTEIEFGREVDPAVLQSAREQAASLAALYNIGYVIFYPPVEGRPPYTDTWQASQAFVRETLPLEPEPFWSQDGIEAYRVRLPNPATSFALDLGEEPSLAWRGDGWDPGDSDTIYDASAAWATGTHSELFAPPLAPADAYTVTVRVHPFAWEGGPTQTAALRIDGNPVGAPIPLEDGWQDVTWSVPGADWNEGLARVEIEWGHAASPQQVAGADDPRELAAAVDSVLIEAPNREE